MNADPSNCLLSWRSPRWAWLLSLLFVNVQLASLVANEPRSITPNSHTPISFPVHTFLEPDESSLPFLESSHVGYYARFAGVELRPWNPEFDMVATVVGHPPYRAEWFLGDPAVAGQLIGGSEAVAGYTDQQFFLKQGVYAIGDQIYLRLTRDDLVADFLIHEFKKEATTVPPDVFLTDPFWNILPYLPLETQNLPYGVRLGISGKAPLELRVYAGEEAAGDPLLTLSYNDIATPYQLLEWEDLMTETTLQPGDAFSFVVSDSDGQVDRLTLPPVSTVERLPDFLGWHGPKEVWSGNSIGGTSTLWGIFVAGGYGSNLPDPVFQLFAGEVGDLSTPLPVRWSGTAMYWTYQGRAATLMTLTPHVFPESMNYWVRIVANEGYLDVARSIVVRRPQPPKVLEQIPLIQDYYAGERLLLKPRYEGENLTQNWYWGEAGDTSWPVENLSPSVGLMTTLPDNVASLWFSLENAEGYAMSESIPIRILPETTPRLLNWPYAAQVYGEDRVASIELVMVGGGLSYQWYVGPVGNTAHPVEIPSWFNGSRYPFSLPFLAEHAVDGVVSYWLRIFNGAGTTDSPPLLLRNVSREELRIVNQPYRSFLSSEDEVPITSYKAILSDFWVETTVPPIHLELYREIPDAAPTLLASTSWPNRSPLGRYYVGRGQGVFSSDGTYFIRVYFGAEWVDSLPIIKKTVTDRERALLVGGVSEGLRNGVRSVRVLLPNGPALKQAWVFPDHAQGAFVNCRHQDLGGGFYDLFWPPTGSRENWLSMQTKDNEVLWLPLLDTNVIGDNNTSELVVEVLEKEVVISPGSSILNLPVEIRGHPESVSWFTGETGDKSRAVKMPIDLSDFKKEELRLWAEVANADHVVQSASLNLLVDPDMPPTLDSGWGSLVANPSGAFSSPLRINGDIASASFFAGEPGDRARPLATIRGQVSSWVVLETEGSSAWVEIESSEGPVIEEAFSVVVPEDCFWKGFGVAEFGDGYLRTELGLFFQPNHYPNLQHSELGWMTVKATEEGIYFYDWEMDGQPGWNWTTSTLFPFIYDFRGTRWIYYYKGTQGLWFYDYTAEEVFSKGNQPAGG